MNYEVVNLQEKTVVGKAVRTTNENEMAVQDIGNLWQEFMSENLFETIKNQVDGKGIGLYTEYEGDATKPYTFMCGLEVNNVNNENLIVKKITNGKYAKFTVKGHMVTAVKEAWNKIWAMDLDRKYTSDFELYHNDSKDMNKQTIDIFISIN